MRILLAEDDVVTARGISLALKAASFIVEHADLGEDALEMVRHYDYDIMLVSAKLPDMQGHEMLRRMRSAKLDVPVLVLTSDTSTQVKIRAFSAGADDVVAKPVDHAELVARLLAIVRRSKGISRSLIQIDALRLDLDCREVTVNDRIVHLTGKEYSVLELLVLRKGTILTKDAFLNHLYGGMDEPEMKIIDVFICKLRRKLQTAGATDMITTVWGRGYMLRETAAVPTTVSNRMSLFEAGTPFAA